MTYTCWMNASKAGPRACIWLPFHCVLQAAGNPSGWLYPARILNIAGYLVEQVLTHQAAATQSFLLKTSILDRFCAPLCEAIFGEIDPAWNVHLPGLDRTL